MKISEELRADLGRGSSINSSIISLTISLALGDYTRNGRRLLFYFMYKCQVIFSVTLW